MKCDLCNHEYKRPSRKADILCPDCRDTLNRLQRIIKQNPNIEVLALVHMAAQAKRSAANASNPMDR